MFEVVPSCLDDSGPWPTGHRGCPATVDCPDPSQSPGRDTSAPAYIHELLNQPETDTGTFCEDPEVSWRRTVPDGCSWVFRWAGSRTPWDHLHVWIPGGRALAIVPQVTEMQTCPQDLCSSLSLTGHSVLMPGGWACVEGGWWLHSVPLQDLGSHVEVSGSSAVGGHGMGLDGWGNCQVVLTMHAAFSCCFSVTFVTRDLYVPTGSFAGAARVEGKPGPRRHLAERGAVCLGRDLGLSGVRGSFGKVWPVGVSFRRLPPRA